MTPEETIRNCIYHYPGLFQSKAQVLHHLFCVIGNGYEWIDGKLVDVCEPDEDPYESAVRRMNEKFLRSTSYPNELITPQIINSVYTKIYVEDCMLIKATHENIDELCKSMKFDPYHRHPLSNKYSKLFNFPDDITPEWRACLEEAKAFFEPIYANSDPSWSEEFTIARIAD